MGFVLYRLGLEPWFLQDKSLSRGPMWTMTESHATVFVSQRAATARRKELGLCAAEVHVMEIDECRAQRQPR